MAITQTTDVKSSFEDWWSKKKHLFNSQMKDSLWLAFADGRYRSNKAVIELAEPEYVQ